MERKLSFRKLYFKIRIVGFLLVIFFIGMLALLISLPVVQTDPVKKADAAILLMGGNIDRESASVDFYKRGLADSIFMVKIVDDSSLQTNQNNILISLMPDLVRTALIKKNVDSTDIRILEGPSGNTIGEARSLSAYCENNPTIETVMVVTSMDHTGRSSKIFKDVFRKNNPGIEIIIPENSYSNFPETKDFSYNQWKAIYREKFKQLAYLLFFRWFI